MPNSSAAPLRPSGSAAGGEHLPGFPGCLRGVGQAQRTPGLQKIAAQALPQWYRRSSARGKRPGCAHTARQTGARAPPPARTAPRAAPGRRAVRPALRRRGAAKQAGGSLCGGRRSGGRYKRLSPLRFFRGSDRLAPDILDRESRRPVRAPEHIRGAAVRHSGRRAGRRAQRRDAGIGRGAGIRRALLQRCGRMQRRGKPRKEQQQQRERRQNFDKRLPAGGCAGRRGSGAPWSASPLFQDSHTGCPPRRRTVRHWLRPARGPAGSARSGQAGPASAGPKADRIPACPHGGHTPARRPYTPPGTPRGAHTAACRKTPRR